MLKKTIEYETFDGEKIKEDFYFNLTKAEIMKMELEIPGGYSAMLVAMINKKDVPLIIKYMDRIVLDSYGRKSPDGRLFEKNDTIRAEFQATNAYSDLLIELLSDADKAAAFIKGIFPVELTQEQIDEAKKQLNI